MIAKHEIRLYACKHQLIYMFLLFCITTPVAVSGWLVVTSPTDGSSLMGPIFGALLLCVCGLSALNALTWLANWAAFQQPILMFSDAGVTYAPPHMPWRAFTIPWDDVTGMTILTHPYWDTNHLLVLARHPARYVSERRQRMSDWWDPSLRGAVIAVSTHWLDGDISTEHWTKLLDEVETTFAPEIARYNIQIHKVED